MPIVKYLDRIRHIDYLLRTKSTGDLKCLTKKLKLSKSSTLEYLKEMKYLGFPIKYCSKRQLYFYEEDGSMVNKLFIKGMSSEEMKRITGGSFNKVFYESNYIGLGEDSFTG